MKKQTITHFFVILLCLFTVVQIAGAQTVYTVTNINDNGPGSLRQAIIDANNSLGAGRIEFAISGSGPHVILVGNELPYITGQVAIDGFSQPGAVAATETQLAAMKIVLLAQTIDNQTSALRVGDNCMIRGLVIQQFGLGIALSGNRNVVEGNYIGVSADGNEAQGNQTHGIIILADSNRIGGATPASRNILSGNGSDGVSIFPNSDYNTIFGNYIGTDAAGAYIISNTGQGVGISGNNNQVGGANSGEGNIICGNRQHGVYISRWSSAHEIPVNNIVRGNKFGTNASGTAALPNRHGITINQGANSFIIENIISWNEASGISVDGNDAVRNQISKNTIHSNGTLGIELNNDDVTLNDAADVDAGPNNLMNYPVLLQAAIRPNSTVLTGSIDTPNQETVWLEIFSNPGGGDPRGYGEGEIFIDRLQPNPDGLFSIRLPLVESRTLISATATDSSGNTSEFAKNIEARLLLPESPVIISPDDNIYLTTASQNFTFTVPDDADNDSLHFSVEIAQDTLFTNLIAGSPFQSQANSGWFSPLPPLPAGTGTCTFTLDRELEDGPCYIRVSAQDSTGFSPASDAKKFIIDNTPPDNLTLQPLDPAFGENWYNQDSSRTIALAFGYDEINPDSIILTSAQIDTLIYTENLPGGLAQMMHLALPVSGAPDGSYTVMTEISDKTQHRATASTVIRLDHTPPVGARASSIDTSYGLAFTVSWRDSATDFAGSGLSGIFDVKLKTGTTDWQPWLERFQGDSAVFVGESGKIYYFEAAAWDNVGNRELFSGQFETFTVVDTTSPPGFDLIVDPQTKELISGDSTTFRIQIKPSFDFDNQVFLSLVDPPVDISGHFSPNPVPGQEAVLTIRSQPADNLPHEYEVIVHGESDVHSQGITYKIFKEDTIRLNILPHPDFELNAEPAELTVRAGDSVSCEISILPEHGFNEMVSLRISTPEELSTAIFSPASIDIHTPSILTIQPKLTAVAAEYLLEISGTSASGATRTTGITLVLSGRRRGTAPNPFTPNGDGFNDFVLFNYPELENGDGRIIIFNFRGKKVIEITDDNRWYGRNESGEALQPGVYLYLVKASGNVIANGPITLIR